MSKISVIINTKNEEKRIERVIKSASQISDNIIVVDMKSSDNTKKIAKKLGARVFEHEDMGYVEPARNFAISKTPEGGWVFILDADEEISSGLVKKIKQIVKNDEGDYYRIPRKNIIFGKWMEHSRWWPDYNIRLFRKGHVSWRRDLHRVPITKGDGLDLPAEEDFSIIHNHYETLNQYLSQMSRYTEIQAAQLIKDDYKFVWKDLIKKPLSEFLSRYFVGEGYKDGLHGLSLSILQSFSEIVMLLKVWENEKFIEQSITAKETLEVFGAAEGELNWWMTDMMIKEKGPIKSLPMKIARKIKRRNGKKKN